MLTNLLVKGDQPKSPSPRRLGMIAVSGNKTLLPLLQALSQENATTLSQMVLVADLKQDYGPLTRVKNCHNQMEVLAARKVDLEILATIEHVKWKL